MRRAHWTALGPHGVVMRWDLTPNPLSIPMERGLNQRMDWADAEVTSGGVEKIDHLKLPEVVSADSGGEVTCVTCWMAEVVSEVSCRRLVARVADNRRTVVVRSEEIGRASCRERVEIWVG